MVEKKHLLGELRNCSFMVGTVPGSGITAGSKTNQAHPHATSFCQQGYRWTATSIKFSVGEDDEGHRTGTRAGITWGSLGWCRAHQVDSWEEMLQRDKGLKCQVLLTNKGHGKEVHMAVHEGASIIHVTVIKYSDRKQLRGRGFHFTHNSSLQSITMGKSWQQGCKTARAHQQTRAERNECTPA